MAYPVDANITQRPTRNIAMTKTFPTNVIEYGGGYQKVTPLSRRAFRSFTLSYNLMSEAEKNNLEAFYDQQTTVTSFDFDRDHILETGTIRVRFAEAFQSTLIDTMGGENRYDVTVSFREV